MSDPSEVVLSEAEQFDALIAAKREEAGQPPPDDPAPPITPDEPAPEAGSSFVEGETAEAPADAIDLDTLPPAVRARLEAAAALEETLKKERIERDAAIGRVAPTQRALVQRDRELAELRQELARLKTPAPQATPAATDAEPDYDSPEWKQYEAEFPNEAKAIRKVNEAQAKRLAAAEARIADFEKRAGERLGVVDRIVEDQTKTRELAALNEAHPDWRDLVLPASQDAAVSVEVPTRQPDGSQRYVEYAVSPDFAAWFEAQHPDKQRWLSSNSAAENIELVADFKRDLYLAQMHEAAAPAATVTPEAEAALKAQQRRQQALASSVAPDLRGGSPSAARADTSKLSDAELFDHLARQRRASNR
jgi:hypothetical protein